ncbi:MAG: D-2-hydroxyacid dehydrogenase family protein [Pelagibacteraceae bacterium]|nr:D-2-hydroxyacid dehydrogenase family protein [Pelagibacteraceae bacterium]
MIKVAVLDDYQNIFREFIDIDKHKDKYDFTIFNQPFANKDEALAALEEFEVLFVMRERTLISRSLISGIKNLKYIMTSGMRNKAIDLEETKKRNIIVCGTDINPNPAAEITWALILGLMRNMKQEIDNMFQGYWQTTVGFELKGKILGLIGLGKIGSQVAKIGKAFGMQVVVWSENLNLSYANELGVLPMSKKELLKNADIVSLHVLLGERYKNLITKKDFEMMKKTCFLINTSRGPIINEEDLVNALDNDDIAGVGLDVYDVEPLPQNHKLRFFSNALLLPHLGYVTEENYSLFYNQMIENLNSCLEGKPKRILE